MSNSQIEHEREGVARPGCVYGYPAGFLGFRVQGLGLRVGYPGTLSANSQDQRKTERVVQPVRLHWYTGTLVHWYTVRK
jgi:hypothetical protein